MRAERQAVGIDVGGTKIAGARVTEGGAVVARTVAPARADDPEATLATMIACAREVRSPDVVAIGVGAAGLADVASGSVRYAPNLAWREFPITARLRDALGLPVRLDNDATAAAWAEYRFGAGRGHRHLLLVTVGTGLGGGMVSDGRLQRGAHGFAGEIGHIIVEPEGPRCGCGNRGCWERVASGWTIEELGRAAIDDPTCLIATLAGGDRAAVRGPLVTEAARAGDPGAIAIFGRVGARLGEGIAGLVNVLDPEIVIVGGGVSAAGELLLEPTRAAFAAAVEAPEHRPPVPIVAAELGSDAGAIGAAVLALEDLVD